MIYEKLLEKIKREIVKEANPVSIFTYGSFNTVNFVEGVSDLDIGVICKKDVSVKLRELAKKFSSPRLAIKIYRYKTIELKSLNVTPFTKSVFVRQLILSAKTIYGKRVIEKMTLPKITLLDAYREASTSTFRVLAGLFLFRSEIKRWSLESTYKACLYATRSIEFLLGEFPIGFKEIYELSRKLKLEKRWKKLIKKAYDFRLGKIKPTKDMLEECIFETITFCNQIAERKIMGKLRKGNKILVT